MTAKTLITKQDFLSSLSLLFVSLPLSAGIAIASKADPAAGVIAAIFGALFFGMFSSTPLAVFGPSAGLSVFISMAAIKFGDFSYLGPAIFLSGVWLFILSFFNVHRLVSIVPRSVSRGMATGIGLILILKMIPHLVGYDDVSIGIEDFTQSDGRNTFSEIIYSLNNFLPGALAISLVSLILIPALRKVSNIAFPIVVVGIIIHQIFIHFLPDFALSQQHMLTVTDVKVHFKSLNGFMNDLPYTLELSFILMAVILIEGFITFDIFQKLDPSHHHVKPLKELRLLGFANALMGIIGALPIMPVLIRSTANVNFGAKTRWSVFMHGIWLALILVCYKFFSFIPMASVASILVYVGFRLIDLKEIKKIFKQDVAHWLPFVLTVFVMIFVDLLWGIFAGFIVGLFFSMKNMVKRSMVLVHDDERYLLKFYKDVSFLNKAELKELLERVPLDKEVLIDGTGNIFIDPEIEDFLEDYNDECKDRGCKVTFLKSRLAVSKLFKEII